jgi:uncharacterized protein YbjQ (UPF0145 family)
MANQKDVLVVTTSSVDGLKIKQYLKPISAHIVAGTNLSSDFFATFSDVFGGRSQSYQKQLVSLYNEAIERIKYAAYEIGANCVIGLNIDIDEISGKGKSMFMITAVGTAVIIGKELFAKNTTTIANEKFENVNVERIDSLRKKKDIIKKAEEKKLVLDDEIWSFITDNQVDEIFPYILKKYSDRLVYDTENSFYKTFVVYVDALTENKKVEFLYNAIATELNDNLVLKLSDIIKELNLLDLNKSFDLLRSNDFKIQKRGLRVVTFDKPFYNKEDITDFDAIREYLKNAFKERGTRVNKKQMLSSKEKEVWTCECGKANNDIGIYCSNCAKDIFGFKSDELKPDTVDSLIDEKLQLIKEYIE